MTHDLADTASARKAEIAGTRCQIPTAASASFGSRSYWYHVYPGLFTWCIVLLSGAEWPCKALKGVRKFLAGVLAILCLMGYEGGYESWRKALSVRGWWPKRRVRGVLHDDIRVRPTSGRES